MPPHCHPAVLCPLLKSIKHQELGFNWVSVLWRIRMLLFPLSGGLPSWHLPLRLGSFTERGLTVLTAAITHSFSFHTRHPFSTAFAFVIPTRMPPKKFGFPALSTLHPPALYQRMPCHCHLHPFLMLILKQLLSSWIFFKCI